MSENFQFLEMKCSIYLNRRVFVMRRKDISTFLMIKALAGAMLFYCPFDISWKDVFCLVFYFIRKYFVLVDHILSETICLLCFCVFFSSIYTKIKVTAKSRSDLCYFYSKVIFWNFCLRKYFLLLFAEFELLTFYNNIVKISEKLNKWNLLKIWLQVTYPTDFCMIWLHFHYGKK